MLTHETHQTTGEGANVPLNGPITVINQNAAVRINVAAQIAGVARRTMYNWIQRGWVEVRYLPNGATLVVVSSIIRATRPDVVGTQQPLTHRARDARGGVEQENS